MTNRGLAAVGAAVVVGMAGCSSTPPDQAAQPTGFTAAPTPENTDATPPAASDHPSPAMGHIHALQINSADQTLYAAAHYGLFRVAEGRPPQLTGDLIQDFMGFTVAGPDHFLASGHPGAGQPGPSNLGLIESTDGGQSWNTLSLSGEADFHALDYAHGRVYGLDSHTSEVMVSEDTLTWQARSPVAAVDLAVSPQDPDEILITTADGVQRTRDGGANYEAVPDAPTLVYLSWPDTGALIGVDSAGSLYASDDGGTTWQARHRLAEPPQAVFASGDGGVFVATATAIYRSSDDAATMTELVSVQ